MKITIHAHPGIRWHKRYLEYFKRGLAVHDLQAEVTKSGTRKSGTDVAILFGPNYWKAIERDGEPYLMVNRVLISTKPGHVNDVVAISWNGFNGRGMFCVEDVIPERLNLFINPSKDVKGWRKHGDYMLLLGQADLGRCGRYVSLTEWYQYVQATAVEPVVFRPHPNNGPRVPLKTHLGMSRIATVLNSTVAVDCLISGVPVCAMDEGNPAYGVCGHQLAETIYPDRLPFFEHLAHCQYFYSEIENGEFWNQLYPMRGVRLCDYGT